MKLNLVPKLLTLFLTVGIISPLSAVPLKVAIIDMKKALTEYHETVAADAEEKVERADIQEDNVERIGAIKALEEEMRKLRADFQDATISPEKKKAIAQVFGEREQTLVALRREREEFIKRRSRALNQKMVTKLQSIRKTVGKQVKDHATGIDVDYVFDSSGLTTSQVPFILYVRNKVDITDDVLKLLNKDAPAK
jgi:Skp family chaperone for outer membrane proteins